MNLLHSALDASARAAIKAQVDETGFAAFGPGALAPTLFADLCEEAETQRAAAWGRAEGQTVDHRNHRANLGPVGLTLVAAPEMLALLAEVAGGLLVPSYEASCYTYYDEPDDFLAPHLDRPGACAFTLIAYLAASWPDGAKPGPGMELQVFAPVADAEPVGPPLAGLATRPNVMVFGRGAEVPHGRPPLTAGEQVVALTACYTFAHDVERDTSHVAILVEEGYAEFCAGQLDDARERFQAALQIDDTCSEAWSGLGFVEWTIGDFAEALQMYRVAARHDGSDASTWSNIGLCLRDLKAFDDAVHAFEVALMLDPAYGPALNEWGNVLQDQGRVNESIGLYLRALSMDPSRAVVHHNLGVAYGRLGETMLAIQAYSAALDRDPAYAHSLEELGLLCAVGGLLDEATAYLERAGTQRAESILASLSEAD